MEYSISKQTNSFLLQLSGNFTFNDNTKFRDLLNVIQESNVQNVTIGLEKLEFIDSAALGMLLLLNDAAKKKNIKITLSGAQGQIKKMLQLSNFDQLFTVHY